MENYVDDGRKKEASATRIHVGYRTHKKRNYKQEKVLGKYLPHAMELINYAMIRG